MFCFKLILNHVWVLQSQSFISVAASNSQPSVIPRAVASLAFFLALWATSDNGGNEGLNCFW